MNSEKIKVIYIAGATRSGSTLLSRLLGEVDGFVNVGEALRWLFNTRRMKRTRPCSCGSPVDLCPFWNKIFSEIEHSDEQAFATSMVRIRYLPLLVSPIKSIRLKHQWSSLLNKTRNLIYSIVVNSNCGIIIDSSKNPANAYVLSQIPEIELHVVHLVRDPRGVVSSWTKPKEYMKIFSWWRVVAWWVSHNLSAEILRFWVEDYRLVRYEDFIKSPVKTIQEIVSMMNGQSSDLSFINGEEFTIGTQHLLGSNPDRQIIGTIQFKENPWSLPWYKNILVIIFTFPLLLRYHYLSPID